MKDNERYGPFKKIAYLIFGIIAVVVTLYLASPLFISTEINEPFPLEPASSISFDQFNRMTEEEWTHVAENMSASAKNQLMTPCARSDSSGDYTIDETMNETVSSSELDNPLISGSFIGVNNGIHNAEDMAKIFPVQNKTNILRLENLKVTNGPDLYVYLSTDKNAYDFVNLGKLKANNGNQNYNIPAVLSYLSMIPF